eukprot:COSAG01_NODE_2357_length_7839_cov_6.117571_9_plen_109_part_00
MRRCWTKSEKSKNSVPREYSLESTTHTYASYGSALLTPVFQSKTASIEKWRVPPASPSRAASNEVYLDEIYILGNSLSREYSYMYVRWAELGLRMYLGLRMHLGLRLH